MLLLAAAPPHPNGDNEMSEPKPITAAEGTARVLVARNLIADAIRDLDVAARTLTSQPLDHDDELLIASALGEMERSLTGHLAYGTAPYVHELDELGVISHLEQTALAARTIAGHLDHAAAELRGLAAGVEMAYPTVKESPESEEQTAAEPWDLYPAAPKAGA